jgi:hypothetical protein
LCTNFRGSIHEIYVPLAVSCLPALYRSICIQTNRKKTIVRYAYFCVYHMLHRWFCGEVRGGINSAVMIPRERAKGALAVDGLREDENAGTIFASPTCSKGAKGIHL